jgi:alpha-D-xyloside xylohydrolase
MADGDPRANGGGTAPGVAVVWNRPGDAARRPACTAFRLYSSSYVKVFVDGREVLERWRQKLEPLVPQFRSSRMTPAAPPTSAIEWEPNSGYIALLHNDPRPEPDRHSLSFASELGHAIDYYFVGAGDMDGVIAGYRALTGERR